MDSIKETQKKYCSQALILAIGAALIFILIGDKAIAKGLLLGTLFSIINFILIAQALHFQLNKTRGKTFLACMGSIWLRYILLAVPLIIGAKMEMFNFFAVAVGIFMVQLVILGHHGLRMLGVSRNNSMA